MHFVPHDLWGSDQLRSTSCLQSREHTLSNVRIEMNVFKCPPVAVAIAKARKDGRKFSDANSVEFNVVDISDMMGWDSGPVKKELKLLLWNFESITHSGLSFALQIRRKYKTY